MKCQVPGCMEEACKNVQVKGIFHGVYLDTIVHVCDNHKPHEVSTAVYAQHAPLVNPYIDVRLKKTGS